ncbi:putative phosphoglycerate mutase [Nocardia mexicana]|uniref:Putative phosphoglycerate mutase n=2 Tax=Nocardia mexicana TaxID=279262 RepID=A0A370GYK9_9NOCA|nr:putative phosphoglycerate mutase [Nocardia mexicana]
MVTASGPADPRLTELGGEQAARVAGALARLEGGPHRIVRVLSSPQRRARETAAPTAEKLGLEVEIHDDLAEYDRDLPVYIPIETGRAGSSPAGLAADTAPAQPHAVPAHSDAAAQSEAAGAQSDAFHREFRAVYERIKAGYLPEQIDGPAFIARVRHAIDEIVSAAAPADTVVVFAHGGVVNVTLQDVLGLDRPLTFPVDYCSITRILYSRTGRRTAATINENGHVWDLLPRNI